MFFDILIIFQLQTGNQINNYEKAHPKLEIKQEIPSPVGSYSSDQTSMTTPSSSSCALSAKSIKTEPVNESPSPFRYATSSDPILIPKREIMMTTKEIKSEIGM